MTSNDAKDLTVVVALSALSIGCAIAGFVFLFVVISTVLLMVVFIMLTGKGSKS